MARDRLIRPPWLVLALCLAGCDDEERGRDRADADTGPDAVADQADDTVDESQPEPQPDAPPDVEPDAEPDSPPDVVDEEVVEPPAEFGLFYAFDEGDPIGIHDLMAVALTADRVYVGGLFEDTGRVSFLERDADPPAPWCLHDGFGWPTGIAEDPTSGDIYVADMIYGLAVITPPAEPGDCGCDVGVAAEPCEVEFIAIDPDAVGIGGVAVAADGTVYASSLLKIEETAGAQAAGPSIIWALTPAAGNDWEVAIVAEGPSLGDTIGIELNANDNQILAADSNGALRILVSSGGAWDLLPDALQEGATGFPTDTAMDATHYFWSLQSPFAHPDREEGGAALRVTLDGSAIDQFGVDDLVWPAGIDTDGAEWFIVDRVTGIWAFR